MRPLLVLLLVFCLPTLPAFAQEDSTKVISLLKEGKELLNGQKTKIVSAQYFGDAFRLSQRLGYYQGEGEALRLLGLLSVYQRNEYSYEAMEYFQKSLAVWQAHGDRYETLHTYLLVADIFSERWHLYTESLGYYKQALLLSEKMQKNSESQQILLKMVRVYLQMDKMEEATQYSQRLIVYYKKQGSLDAITELKLDIAQHWAQRQDYKKAREVAKEAQRNFEAQGGNPAQFATYLQAIQQHQQRTETISASRLALAAITVVVIMIILTISYFYARRQVKKGNV
jgi:tetratricopeptide (TPR) repeat protein